MRGWDGQQLTDARQAGAGLLQSLHLAADLFDRPREHLRVGEDQVHAAKRDGACQVQIGAHGQTGGSADGQQESAGLERRVAQGRGQQLASQQSTRALVEAAHDIAVAPLARMSSVPSSRSSMKPNSSALAWRAVFQCGTATKRSELIIDQRQQQEHANRGGDSPVDQDQQDHQADDEQRIADHVDHESREVVRKRADVAVDALDELAWRVGVQKIRVEPEAVPGQVGAKALVAVSPRFSAT